MNDLIMIVIRFLLYLDLMVIFGLPFFQIYGISGVRHETYNLTKEGANKQVISSQVDSLIKISRIWADFFPANTSNQPI